MTTVERFELQRAMAESFAVSSTLLGTEELVEHLRDVDARLAMTRGLDSKLALTRDYALTSALLAYVRDVAPFVRTEAMA